MLFLFTGMSYLFVAIPHTFSKYQLSPVMALLLYATYILLSIQHLVIVFLSCIFTTVVVVIIVMLLLFGRSVEKLSCEILEFHAVTHRSREP